MIDVLNHGDSGPSLKVKDALCDEIRSTRMIHSLDHDDLKTEQVGSTMKRLVSIRAAFFNSIEDTQSRDESRKE